MLGGMLAGTDQCEGRWEYEYLAGANLSESFWQIPNPGYATTKRKRSFTYYGMSTHHAQSLYEDNLKDYRASEGTKIIVPYKGQVGSVVQELLGGIRSCCCYIGADSVKHMSKCSQFCRVTKIHDNINPIFGL